MTGRKSGSGRVPEQRGRYETGREAGGEPDDRRIGVVRHTQGSGKSLTMTFYAGGALANRTCHQIDLVTRAIAPERAWG